MMDAQPVGRIPGVAGFYPWGRYWAKMIDCTVVGLIVGIAFAKFIKGNQVGAFALITALFPLAEGFAIAAMGTTPGKALFRISIVAEDGQRLTAGNSIKRSYAAWLEGAFLGVPLLSLWAMMKAYENYKRDGITPWDRQGGARYVSERPTWVSWLVLVLGASAYIGLAALGASQPS